MADSRRPRTGPRQRVAGLRKRSTTGPSRSTGAGLNRPGNDDSESNQPQEAASTEATAGEESAEATTSTAGAGGSSAEVADGSSAASGSSRDDEVASDAAVSGEAGTREADGTGSSATEPEDNQTGGSAAGSAGQAAGDPETSTAAASAGTVATELTDERESNGAAGNAEAAAPVGKAERRERQASQIWTPSGPAASEPENGSETETGSEAGSGGHGPSGKLVTAGFVGAAVLACLAIWFGVEVYANSSATQNETLVDQSGTSEVNGQVSDAVSKIFSYDFADTGKSEQAAKNVLTGDAIKQYDQLFATVKQQAPQQKLVVTTTVKASSVLRLEDDRAQVLLFVDQNATRTDNGSNQVGPAQVVVNAEQHGDQWKISSITQH